MHALSIGFLSPKAARWLFAVGCLLAGCRGKTDSQLWDDALAAMRRKETAAAAQALDELLRRRPTHGKALLYRAQLARDAGDDEAALAWLARVPDDAPKEGGTARFVEGSILIARQRAREAEARLRRACELNPDFAQPHERLVQLFVLQRRKADLLEQLRQLAELRPPPLPELALQITAGERMAAPEEAIPQLEGFVAADADDFASRYALGVYYVDALRFDDALRTLRRLVADAPQHADARAALAQLLLEREDLDAAADVLASVDWSSVVVPELWRARALYALECAEWDVAAYCLAEVIRRDVLDRAAFVRMGQALQRLGDVDAAGAALQRAVQLARLREQFETLGIQMLRGRLTPADVVQAAELLAELGETERAAAWYQEALKLDPRSAAARKGLAAVSGAPGPPIAAILAAAPRPERPLSARRRPRPASATANAVASHSAMRFADEHAAAQLEFQYFNGASGFKYLIESMGGGAAVIDFDLDTWPDLFFPQGARLPLQAEDQEFRDELWRNLQGERFVRLPEVAGVGDPGYGLGAAVGDLDNDGFDDLVIGNFGRSTVLHNQGDGTFVDVSAQAGMARAEMSTSVGCADLDRDGDLDLFVVNYVDSLKVCRDDAGAVSACSPSNHAAVDDRIYRNLGDGRFEELTAAGLAPGGKGLGLVLADFDDDGWVDAFVANDTTPNFLYRNHSQSGLLHMSEEGLLAGVALSEAGIAQAGMGVACGDLNDDLFLDLYVTYFYREANGLYLNNGQGSFVEATRAWGLHEPTVSLLGFGTQAVDFDLDGRRELFVANGHIDDQRAKGIPWKMSPQLFVLGAPGRYVEASAAAGEFFSEPALGRGVACLDWNGDRRPDLVVNHQDRPAALLTNQTRPVGNSLELRLIGVTGNRSAVGARVLASLGGKTARVDVTSGDGFLASNERRLRIGMGAAERVERLEVRWPDGGVSEYSDLPANSAWTLVQGRRAAALGR